MNERKNKSSPKNSPKKTVANGKLKHSDDFDVEEGEDNFDVYNIESALPNMDWDTLEQQLQQAADFEKRKKEVTIFLQNTSTATGNIGYALQIRGYS
jgi:hypothetical protein